MALTGDGSARNWCVTFFGVSLGLSVPGLIALYNPAGSHRPASPNGAIFVGLELLFGLVALVLLWLPESGWFFTAARQARDADWYQRWGYWR
jgi:hypothetical protein